MVKRETVDYISYDDFAQVKQRMVDDRGVKRQKVARKMGHLENINIKSKGDQSQVDKCGCEIEQNDEIIANYKKLYQ